MEVRFHPEAQAELDMVPLRERPALLNVVEKLKSAPGGQLPYPHSSAVRGRNLRELRPRQGRSQWRAFYARVRDRLWVLAIGPEAQHDSKDFDRAVSLAEQRLKELKEVPDQS